MEDDWTTATILLVVGRYPAVAFVAALFPSFIYLRFNLPRAFRRFRRTLPHHAPARISVLRRSTYFDRAVWVTEKAAARMRRVHASCGCDGGTVALVMEQIPTVYLRLLFPFPPPVGKAYNTGLRPLAHPLTTPVLVPLPALVQLPFCTPTILAAIQPFQCYLPTCENLPPSTAHFNAYRTLARFVIIPSS